MKRKSSPESGKSKKKVTKIGDSTDANFPTDGEGRVYHIGVKRGEVANRLLSVGDPARAERYSALIDLKFSRVSNRGFATYSGLYKGKPVTIMSIGMGGSMMDFMVRESMYVVDGPMAVIRIGTCGTPSKSVPIGSVVVAEKSHKIQLNYDAFRKEAGDDEKLYIVSRATNADPGISNLFKEKLSEQLDPDTVMFGTDLTSDSFYSTQGRSDSNFLDRNDDLIQNVMEQVPDAKSLQMETFELFHLAEVAKHSVHSTAAAIVLAQRQSNEFLPNEEKYKIEAVCGSAALDTLTEFELESEVFYSN